MEIVANWFLKRFGFTIALVVLGPIIGATVALVFWEISALKFGLYYSLAFGLTVDVAVLSFGLATGRQQAPGSYLSIECLDLVRQYLLRGGNRCS